MFSASGCRSLHQQSERRALGKPMRRCAAVAKVALRVLRFLQQLAQRGALSLQSSERNGQHAGCAHVSYGTTTCKHDQVQASLPRAAFAIPLSEPEAARTHSKRDLFAAMISSW